MTGKPCSLYSTYFYEDEPVNNYCKHVEQPLQPIRLVQGYESNVGIKVRRQVPYLQAKFLCILFFLFHHRHPVADAGINNQIGECWGQELYLGNSTL